MKLCINRNLFTSTSLWMPIVLFFLTVFLTQYLNISREVTWCNKNSTDSQAACDVIGALKMLQELFFGMSYTSVSARGKGGWFGLWCIYYILKQFIENYGSQSVDANMHHHILQTQSVMMKPNYLLLCNEQLQSTVA